MSAVNFKDDLRKFVAENDFTKLDFLEVKRKAIAKMNSIRDFHNHYKTHFEQGSRELCELRCVTAICMAGQAERIRAHFCATKKESGSDFSLWEDFKERWEKIGDTAEQMAESYKNAFGKYPNLDEFIFFGLDYETHEQRVIEKEERQFRNKNAIGFTAEMSSVEFDDNRTVKNKLGFY